MRLTISDFIKNIKSLETKFEGEELLDKALDLMFLNYTHIEKECRKHLAEKGILN